MVIITAQSDSRNPVEPEARVAKVDLERLDEHLKQYLQLLRGGELPIVGGRSANQFVQS